MVQIFKHLTVGTDLYSYELTWVSEYNKVLIFIYPCLLVSIPASIATTGIRSDAPYEHAQYQGWIIVVEYRLIIHPYGVIRLVHFTPLGNWRVSEASKTLLVIVQWKTRYVYTYIYIHICYSYTMGTRGISE